MSFKFGISIIFIPAKNLGRNSYVSDKCNHFSNQPLYVTIDQCNMASVSGKSMHQFSLVYLSIILLFSTSSVSVSILYNPILELLTTGALILKFSLKIFNIQGYCLRSTLVFKELSFHFQFSSEDSAFNRCSPMQTAHAP